MGLLNMLDKLNYYANIVLYVVIGLIMLGLGLFIYFNKFLRKFRKKEDTTDYSQMKREESRKFVKLDSFSENMYEVIKEKYFTAGIRCIGFDYHTAHAYEQLRVMNNYISFINVIDKPLQFFLQCKDVDVESVILQAREDQYRIYEEIKRHEKELENLNQTLKELELQPTVSQATIDQVKERIKKVSRARENAMWEFEHIEHQIAYTKAISSVEEEPQREDHYFFSYVYNPDNFAVDLTEDEIRQRAKEELEAKANRLIAILAKCNVKAEIMTTDELKQILRRSYRPITANMFKLRDVEKSSYYDLVTTTDTYKEMEKRAIKEESMKRIYNLIQKGA